MKLKALSVTTACVASLVLSASAGAQSKETASPKQAPHAGKVMVTGNGDQFVIQFDVTRPQAWSYNMSTGKLTPTTPEPQTNPTPIGSIGVVVTKNLGGGAERTMPTHGGSADLSSLEEGDYKITIRLPHSSHPNETAKREHKPFTKELDRITFHVNVTPEGMTIDKASAMLYPKRSR